MRAIPLVLVLLMTACGGARPGLPAWQSPIARDHPLAGRIWEVKRHRWIPENRLVTELARARFVLLGEKHDNRDHHVLEARLVSKLARAVLPRRPAVAFEMIEVDRQSAVDAAVAASPTDPDAIARAVEWHHGGWPEFSAYRPVFQAALDFRLPVLAANLPRSLARALVRDGLGAMPPGDVGRLGLDAPLPTLVRAAMARELKAAHCGMLPEAMIDGMVLAQRARDAAMADVLATRSSAILVAGAGHVREDRGVPSHLGAAPDGQTRTVAFEEVAPDDTEPGDYTSRWDGDLPFDYVWFTPVASAEDPCASLRTRR